MCSSSCLSLVKASQGIAVKTKLDKDQLETKVLSLKNRSLTQEMMQAESRIQDLCEDLVKNEIVHAVMRKSKNIYCNFSAGRIQFELCKKNTQPKEDKAQH